MSHRVIFTALLLAALLSGAGPGCRSLAPGRPTRPQELAVRSVLRRLEQVARARDLAALPGLFAPECRDSCVGFVPRPGRVGEHEASGYWWPRLEAGSLLDDLAGLLASYRSLSALALEPLEVRVFHREVFVQARLDLHGRDGAGHLLRDRGQIRLALRQTPAGWRISALRPARMERVIRLDPEEPATTGAAPPDGATDDADETAETSGPPISEPGNDPPGNEDSAADDQPATPPPLEVMQSGIATPIARHGGPSGTVLLIRSRGRPAGRELCRALASSVQGRARVRAGQLLLDGEPGGDCPLPPLVAAPASQQQLAHLRPLLPLVAILDGEGRILRLISGPVSLPRLEAELDRLTR